MAEIQERFGTINVTRLDLFRRLEELVGILRDSGLVECVYVDGSFVTVKEEPGDIDLIVVLPKTHDWGRSYDTMAEYLALDRKHLKKRFGFDIFIVNAESETLSLQIEFFAQIKEREDLNKGILRMKP